MDSFNSAVHLNIQQEYRIKILLHASLGWDIAKAVGLFWLARTEIWTEWYRTSGCPENAEIFMKPAELGGKIYTTIAVIPEHVLANVFPNSRLAWVKLASTPQKKTEACIITGSDIIPFIFSGQFLIQIYLLYIKKYRLVHSCRSLKAPRGGQLQMKYVTAGF